MCLLRFFVCVFKQFFLSVWTREAVLLAHKGYFLILWKVFHPLADGFLWNSQKVFFSSELLFSEKLWDFDDHKRT